jgi:hypothetical protein
VINTKSAIQDQPGAPIQPEAVAFQNGQGIRKQEGDENNQEDALVDDAYRTG